MLTHHVPRRWWQLEPDALQLGRDDDLATKTRPTEEKIECVGESEQGRERQSAVRFGEAKGEIEHVLLLFNGRWQLVVVLLV
jgi:hypothetical protein